MRTGRHTVPPSAFSLQPSAFPNWCSHVDLHHEPSPSHGEMQHSYTLGAPGNAECGIRNAESNTALCRVVGSALRVSRSTLGMAAGVGLAPTPPVLQTGVQTFYTIQRPEWRVRSCECRVIRRPFCPSFCIPHSALNVVVPAGNAPASPAYRGARARPPRSAFELRDAGGRRR
jgi:hypothetical protein